MDDDRPTSVASSPTVTVIIIFLNGERFIAEAIESVRAQTIREWEIVLVDDGTTDGARAIADRFAAAEPERIRVIEHPGKENRGMSASRNAGIAAARGRYVAFLDADDILLPRRLAVHAAVLDANPELGMTMGPTLMWSSWQRKNAAARKRGVRHDMTTVLGLPPDRPLQPPIVTIGFLESGGGNVPGICSLMVRRDAALAVGGFENAFRTLYEDQVFYFKLTLRYPVQVIDEVLDYYRQHEDSACSVAGGMKGDAKMRPMFLDWLQGYLIEEGVRSRRLWRAYRRAMFPFDRPDLFRIISLPRRMIDAWNVTTRRLVIRVLTPRLYNALRAKFRLGVVNIDDVY